MYTSTMTHYEPAREQIEVYAQQCDSCIARKPISVINSNQWVRRDLSVIFRSLRCGVQQLQYEVDYFKTFQIF